MPTVEERLGSRQEVGQTKRRRCGRSAMYILDVDHLSSLANYDACWELHMARTIDAVLHGTVRRRWSEPALLVLLMLVALGMPARSYASGLPSIPTLIPRLAGNQGLSASRMLLLIGNSAIPALRQACRSSNWPTRYRAIATLGQLGAKSAVKQEADRLLHDADWRVRISAIVACRQALSSDVDDFTSLRSHERCALVKCVIDSIRSDKTYRVGKKIVAALDGDDWRAQCLTRSCTIEQCMVTVDGHRLLFSVTYNFPDDENNRRACRACVLFKVGSQVRRQELVWPGNCCPISLSEDKSCVRQVQFGHTNLLMVLANDLDSGTWDCTTPLLFRYKTGKWAAVQDHPRSFSFSCYGGFKLRGNCCSVFDFDYIDGGYSDPQPYVLRRYYFSNGAFHAARTLHTKHKYISPNQRDGHSPCPIGEDPMHEFGLRWSFDH